MQRVADQISAWLRARQGGGASPTSDDDADLGTISGRSERQSSVARGRAPGGRARPESDRRGPWRENHGRSNPGALWPRYLAPALWRQGGDVAGAAARRRGTGTGEARRHPRDDGRHPDTFTTVSWVAPVTVEVVDRAPGSRHAIVVTILVGECRGGTAMVSADALDDEHRGPGSRATGVVHLGVGDHDRVSSPRPVGTPPVALSRWARADGRDQGREASLGHQGRRFGRTGRGERRSDNGRSWYAFAHV